MRKRQFTLAMRPIRPDAWLHHRNGRSVRWHTGAAEVGYSSAAPSLASLLRRGAAVNDGTAAHVPQVDA